MRPIDASKLLFEIQVCSWDSERDKDMAEDLVLGMPTLTPPNEWVSVKDAMPPEHVFLTLNGFERLSTLYLIFQKPTLICRVSPSRKRTIWKRSLSK